MKKLFFLLLPFLSFIASAQQTPTVAIQEVFKDTVVLSWVVPSGSTSTVIERATDRNFTSPVQVYNGSFRMYVDRGLAEHSWYYYRFKSGYPGPTFSAWVVDSIKTFWTPTATSQGGHRVATSADLSIDPFINVGDYLIVGSDSYAENDLWGASVGGWFGHDVPALTTPGAKICVIGGIGYDFLNVLATNNPGVTITNIGGQVKGRLTFMNMKRVNFTGRYDPVKKTGNSRYLGFDGDRTKLYESFGFYIKGRWDHPEVLLSHMGGQTDSSTFEYIEGGGGGSSAVSIKNDGSSVPMVGNEIRWLYIHDTGDEGFYIGSTQNPPQTPITSFNIHDIQIVRAGLNSFQMGNMKGANIIRHFATVGGSFEYNNAFMKWQDQAIQLQPREDGYSFDSSIIAGSTGDMLNWYMTPEVPPATPPAGYVQDNPQVTQTSYIRNNVWYDSKSRGFSFLQIRNGFKGTSNFADNFIGRLGSNGRAHYAYQQLYYLDSVKRSDLIGTYSDANITTIMNGTNNTYDTSLIQPVRWMQPSTGITINTSGTTYVNDLPVLQFNNYMDHMVDSAYSLPERWMDLQGTKWVTAKLNWNSGYRSSRFGTSFEKIMIDNRSTSTTTIDPVLNATIDATVGTNRRYNVGESLWFYRDVIDNATFNFIGHINTYNSSTGAVNLTIDSVTGSGSYSNWAVQHEIQTIQLRRIYHAGAIVRHEGKFFISLQNNNVSHVPNQYADDAWWKLIVFSNGRIYPPDDLRLPDGNFYKTKGMGLSDPTPTSPPKYRRKVPVNFNFQIRRR